MKDLFKLLENEAKKRNDEAELILGGADPLQVAKDLDDDRAILLCALFAYGNANAIVKFLKKLDFSLLNSDEENIRKKASEYYYRFQSKDDVAQIFLTLSRMGKNELKDTFLQGYLKEKSVIYGVFEIIKKIRELNSYDSKGYRFLIGTLPKNGKPSSPYKRWMMFLRWMVRKDALDLGLWNEVSPADLIIPLDTHTFNVSRKLGLLKRKTYDFKAAVELTEKLKEFSPKDPVKYDFALYRIGQQPNPMKF
ncbi:TIGR02757 family protein [Hydrogenimonas thermophila]|uniref:TIGR02757 family protein n=1 Tax=Hydrogenimonas thermophila TaxID=223786 RepID=UPI0029370F82|nr:TIGR02757 family protein [Hydrogenimonas thermophila]WOE68723.1 TIGR02757 family protein [Hydrogenimonas thermophila]WOE71234.1 TIGR02757 family protein [Hydrogenimonas thermophila]